MLWQICACKDRQNSALFGYLTDMYGDPIHIEIIGIEVIERKFGDAPEKMIEILKRFKHFNNDLFSESIKIEIIRENSREVIE